MVAVSFTRSRCLSRKQREGDLPEKGIFAKCRTRLATELNQLQLAGVH